MEARESDKPGFFRELAAKKAKQGYAASACRYALTTLTGGKDVEVGKGREQVIVDAANGLLSAWRARLVVLQQAGWKSIDTASKLQVAGNCAPVGVATSSMSAFSCQRYHVCPFCWCRHRVLDLFARAREVWERQPEGPVPFDLVEVRNERLYPLENFYVDAAFDWIKRSKSKYYRLRLSDAYGGFMLCTVESPNYHKKERHYRLYQRILALVPKLAPTPSDELQPGDVGEFEQVTRSVRRTFSPDLRGLAAAVGRVCIYPAQMMRGNAKEIAEILNAQSVSHVEDKKTGKLRRKVPVRMSEFYGVLRKQRVTI